MKRFAVTALCCLGLAGHPAADREKGHGPVHSFRLVSTFLVPGGNSAEIVAATPDGLTLVYTDAVGRTLGIVDISNPAAPAQVATIPVDGPASPARRGRGTRGGAAGGGARLT